MLVADYKGYKFTPYQEKKLKRAAAHSIENAGGLTSASGASAAFALNYCNDKKYDYRLICIDGRCSIEKLEKTNDRR